MYQKDLVSCIIPTYKRSDTLTRAIDSILNQTYQNFEILVVDDNIPNSEESKQVQKILNKYKKEKRVRYITQKEHINGAVARNVGINAAKGEFVSFLDDDDEWIETKLEKQVNYLKKHKNLIGTTSLYSINHNNKETGRCHPYTGENLQFKVLSRQVAIYTSTFLGRKKVILESGAFDPKLLRHQDLQFFTDLLNHGNIEPINEILVKLHTDSEINKPNTKKLINVKKEFFNSVENTIKKYDKKLIKRIKNAHYFEIIFSALKEKRIDIIIKHVLMIGLSFQSYKDVLNRYKSRK